MKKYHIFILLLTSLLVLSCQQDNEISEIGYLKLEVGTNAYVNPATRIIDEYNPKQIAVQILDANNSVMTETDDWETLKGKQIRLSPGVYTVKASSNGFDGSEAHFDTPYYAGSETVTIEKGVVATANITCTQANVKVTVNYDQTFIDAFQNATATVTSSAAENQSLEYVMGTELRSGYFPVGELTANITVVNKAGESHTQDYSIKHADGSTVAARDHFILNFKVAESGSVEGTDKPGITVTVDGTEVIYTFEFDVSTAATIQLTTYSPEVLWSSFVHLEGAVTAATAGWSPDGNNMKFEWKAVADSEWSELAATESAGTYTAVLRDLTPNTEYEYRMTYKTDSEEYTSTSMRFTTDATPALYNGGFEHWYQDGKTWDAISETDFNSGYSFWDSSNLGTTTGVGAMVNVNPTQGVTSPARTGNKAAELKSQYAAAFGFGKFAAASLYSGTFGDLVGTNGAYIHFGRPFTARPIQLKGWYQYSTGLIDYLGDGQPSNTVTKNDNDLWSAYIVLVNGSLINTSTYPTNANAAENAYTLDNTNMSGTSKDFNALLNDPDDSWVVAYGALPDEKCVTASEWTEFTVDLTYKNLTTKPTHVIIVFSSSKYGDYFTGSTSSLLYLDDIELIYGIPTVVD